MLELVLIFVHIHRYSLTHSFQLSTYNFELVTYDLWRMIFDNRLEKKLVGVTGFEPTTPTSRTWCSTRLSYTPMMFFQ